MSGKVFNALKTSYGVVGRIYLGQGFKYPIANCPVSRLFQASRSAANRFTENATVINNVVGTGIGVFTMAEALKEKSESKINNLEFALKFGGGLLGFIAGPASLFGAFSKYHARETAGQYTAFVVAYLGTKVEAGKTAMVLIKEADKPFDPPEKKAERITTAAQDWGLAIHSLVAAAPGWGTGMSAALNLSAMFVNFEQARRSELTVATIESFVAHLGQAVANNPDKWDITVDHYK